MKSTLRNWSMLLMAAMVLGGIVGLGWQPETEAQAPARKYFRGYKKPANLAHLRELARARHGDIIGQLPKATAAQYDCRTLGIVPPVRDQGQCGSCWDFSGSGVVTSALIKAGQIPNADNGCSEQYTLDCGQNGGCNGDDNTTVLSWAKSSGLPLDKDYGTYQANAHSCKYSPTMKLYKLADWGFCDGQGVANTDRIKAAMVAYGPIGSAVAADDSFSNYRPGQVFDQTTSQGIDHDVILVGWDDTKGSKGAWLMRNSWGPSWGDQGYMWIGYGVNLIGTEAVWATAAQGPSPPPVPPVPPVPPPTPGSVTLALTPDQVQSVIQQSGAVVITPDTTAAELLRILEGLQKRKK